MGKERQNEFWNLVRNSNFLPSKIFFFDLFKKQLNSDPNTMLNDLNHKAATILENENKMSWRHLN